MAKLITNEEIGYLICAALEGGSNHWYMNLKVKRAGDCTPDTRYYDAPLLGGHLLIIDDEGHRHILDKVAIERGLSTLSKKYPWHYKDFKQDRWDCETADAFLQCSVFGDIVYG